MNITPGEWKLGRSRDSVITDPNEKTDKGEVEYYGGKVVAESIATDADRLLIASAPEMKKQLNQLAEIIARNLTAWDTSKDKTQGQLPWVYLENKRWYKTLTGEEYVFHKAIKKYDIQ